MSKLKALKKTGDSVLIPLGVTVAGGVAANQFPQTRKKTDIHLKGKLEKRAPEPIFKAAPGFNHKMANAVYSIIMKMDEESAREYIHHILSNYIEETVQKNLDFFQDGLNRQIDARVKAARSVITKMALEDPEKAKPYAEAFAEITKADWDEKLHPRARTGRFTTKVKPAPAGARPLHPKRARQLGVVTPKSGQGATQYNKLTPQQKAQYQAEYSQLSQFLQSVTSSVKNPGDAQITYVVDRGGNLEYEPPRYGTKLPYDLMLDGDTRVVGAEAKHTDLHAGTMPYSVANSVAGFGEGVHQVAGHMSNEHRSALNENDIRYKRVGFAADFLGSGAQQGSKRWAAAEVGRFVGEHGSEAEQVFGPSMRKTAYRYRGVERKPDEHLVSLYERSVAVSQQQGDFNADRRTAVRREYSRLQREWRIKEAQKLQSDKSDWRADPSAIRIPDDKLEQLRAKAAAKYPADEPGIMRTPTWDERSAGRKTLAREMKFKLPEQGLYELQLASGNTPPSEGFLIDKKGKIVTQAIGYGDDHYLPFNLKHLSKLRGGEYIRTRSVGGPTSEDIYVGLMSGARAVTVVSRSGTYTVQFEEDFKGGRRYNDKALRMTRRYQQILDAVQSEQVERSPVPQGIQQKIKARVEREYSYETAAERKRITQQEIDEYKKHPELTDEDEAEIADLSRIKMAVDPQKDEKAALAEARGDIMRTKAIYFKLDAQGYQDALDALREQFPYYIGRPQVTIANESEGSPWLNRERDRGYVEPGRIRPTEANAGWYGTGRLGDMGNAGTGKISASKTNHQRGMYGSTKSPTTAGASAAAASEDDDEKPAAGGKKSFKEAAREVLSESSKHDAANHLIEELKRGQFNDPAYRRKGSDSYYPMFAMTPKERADHLATDEGKEELKSFLAEQIEGRDDADLDGDTKRALQRYYAAGSEKKSLDKSEAHIWQDAPAVFSGSEFDKNAPAERRALALNLLSKRTPSLHDQGEMSEMSDDQLKQELETYAKIHEIVKRVGPMDDGVEVDRDELLDLSNDLVGRHDHNTIAALQMKPDQLVDRMMNIQKIRTLKSLGANTAHGPDSPRAALRGKIEAQMAALQIVAAQGIDVDADEKFSKQKNLLAELNHETGGNAGWDLTKLSDHQVDSWLHKLSE